MPIDISAEDQPDQPAQTVIPSKPGKAGAGQPVECSTWGDTPPTQGQTDLAGTPGLPGANAADGVNLEVPILVVGQVNGTI